METEAKDNDKLLDIKYECPALLKKISLKRPFVNVFLFLKPIPLSQSIILISLSAGVCVCVCVRVAHHLSGWWCWQFLRMCLAHSGWSPTLELCTLWTYWVRPSCSWVRSPPHSDSKHRGVITFYSSRPELEVFKHSAVRSLQHAWAKCYLWDWSCLKYETPQHWTSSIVGPSHITACDSLCQACSELHKILKGLR